MPLDSTSDGSRSSEVTAAFDLLHPGVRQKLWDMRWTQLRKLQTDCIRAVLTTADQVILTAGTASGKTEAAFLPVLSRIADQPAGGVRALYIGPLKALINDQFRRVGELCDHLNVPVHHWHGDVSPAEKKTLIREPAGVLLTTPESLESLFINRSQFLVPLFGALQFVVIDELHSFLGQARGLHLRSLLSRLAAFVTGSGPRLIGLSATIGDPHAAEEFISPGAQVPVLVIEGEPDTKELRLRVHGYESVPVDSSEEPSHFVRLGRDLVKHCHGAANLVFANSKAQVEELADRCNRLARADGLLDQFLVHHGSLAAEVRKDVEAALKSGANVTSFCSSTLEMGIDIGSVRMVGQVGSPWTVASLKQRVGRSGRRESEARLLRMYICCEQATADSTLFDRLHLELIQAIATTELMLGGWVETEAPAQCDLSTLTQQVISVIAQTGGVRAVDLFDRLCVRGPFGQIEQPVFVRLLRELAARDVLEQMAEGDLILGLRGEHIRRDRGFYAVFPTPDEYAVIHDAEQIGKVTTAMNPGEHLLLAGRRWKVVDVDEDRLMLFVQPARGWKPPPFSGSAGTIHPRVRQEMHRVLASTTQYAYLDDNAADLLAAARLIAKAADVGTRSLISLGPNKTFLVTWTGSRIQDTLRAMFATLITEPADEQIGLVFEADVKKVAAVANRLVAQPCDPISLAKLLKNVSRRKYDWLLSDELVHLSMARDWLEVEPAKALLRQLMANPRV